MKARGLTIQMKAIEQYFLRCLIYYYKQTTQCLAVKVGVENIILLRLLYYMHVLQTASSRYEQGTQLNKPRKAVIKIKAHRSLPCYSSVDAQLFIKSLSSKVEYGVPQGSILGGLLFNIFMNDLPSVPQDCLTQNYVLDDSKLK